MSTTNTITWSKSPELDVAIYNIYRKIGSPPTKIPGDLFASVPATQTTFVDTVTTDGDYFYGLTAIDTSKNESALSNVKDKMVDSVPPTPPVLLSVV